MSHENPPGSPQMKPEQFYHVGLNSCLLNFSDVIESHNSSYPDANKIVSIDEFTSQLIVLLPDQGKVIRLSYSPSVHSLPAGVNPQSNRPAKREIQFSVQDKSITCAKFSPDDNFIAFQSNNSMVEFIHLRDESQGFIQVCKKATYWNGLRNSILGFFWTSVDNIFFVTYNGVDLYQFPPTTSNSYFPSKKKELKLLKEQKTQINWFVYSPKKKLLLASTGLTTVNPNNNSVTSIQPFYFEQNNIVKLPKFNIEKPQPSNMAGAKNKIPTPLKQEELVIASIYGKLYCIHVDCQNSLIVLYQITREEVKKTLTIPIPLKETFYIHIIDNLLIVHCVESKVALLYDTKKKRCQDFPFAAPLPMSPIVPPTTSIEGHVSEATFAEPYSASWSYLPPNLILDAQKGFLWDVTIHLEAIAASCTGRKKLIHFVLRRTLPQSKELLLRHLRNGIQDQETLTTLAKLFDGINYVLATSIFSEKKERFVDEDYEENYDEQFGASKPKQATPRLLRASAEVAKNMAYSPSSPHSPSLNSNGALLTARNSEGYIVVTQDDMYQHVFVPVEEDQALDYKFMIGVVTQYTKSLNFNHIPVEPFLYELLINYLVRNDKYYQLHQMLQYHVVADSIHVACQLLSLEASYPPAYQLALDMLKRLQTDDRILEVLLTKNQIIPALRFIRSHKNLKFSPARVLEVTAAMNNPTLYYTVYKFFEGRREIKVPECNAATKAFQTLFPAEQ